MQPAVHLVHLVSWIGRVARFFDATPGGWGAENPKPHRGTGPRGNNVSLAVHCGVTTASTRPHFDRNEEFSAALKPRARLAGSGNVGGQSLVGYDAPATVSHAEGEMPQHPEDILEGKKRPFTGAEYLQSLRDGREVYIYGERVEDVTTHPAFRNAAASVAKLYDALHDPTSKEVLTGSTDTGSGGYTHKFFKVARSREDVIGQRDAIAAWARITYGWLGRSPDYKAAFLNTLGANADFYGPFADNARA